MRKLRLKLSNVPLFASEPNHTNLKDISLFKGDIWQIIAENKICKEWTDVSKTYMQAYKYAHIEVCNYPQICKYASMYIYSSMHYASMQECKYASMQVCTYASMLVC